MFTRALRITDKAGNAFLKINVWLGERAVAALADAKNRIGADVQKGIHFIALIVGLIARFFGWIIHLIGLGIGLIRRMLQFASSRASLTASQTASRAVTIGQREHMKTETSTVRVHGQDRALSAFATTLLGVLLVLILWSTNPNDPLTTHGSGFFPLATPLTDVTALPTTQPTSTPLPDPLQIGGSIAYTMRENGQDDIWALGVGQGSPIRLTNHPADDRDPAWSPDGSKLAFASRRDGNWELYVMDIGSGNVSRLTYTPGFEAAPAWSPDGLWLVYEGYQENNLDIYVISVDGMQGPIRLTQSDAPDFSPAWSPQPGRQIAYVSWRGGSKDIFVLSLDDPREGAALNLTNTPDLNEDHPAWDPNGQLVAYSAPTDGESLVYVKPVGSPGSEPAAIGRGAEPTWSPNGGSLIYAVHQESRTFLITGQFGNFGVASHVIDVPGSAADLSWARTEIPGPVIRHGSQLAALAPPPYSEEFAVFENPDYRLNPLNNVQAPAPYLSDRVDDSFNALREAALQKTGFDLLGVLQDAWWEMGRRPQPGEAVENWHLTGRAFSLDENLSRGFPPKIWLVREESPTRTYWRVYVRAEVQTGQLGEPLREMPWDFSARTSGDVRGYEQGGKLLGYIPEGYYVDFTQLATDYGWERIAADRTWRQNYAGILYWQFQKTDNLSWQQAMLEIYRPNELSRFLGKPTPLPPLPTSTPTPEITRTPTPLPPDMQ